MTISIAYNDIQHSIITQRYRMDNRALASAILALISFPVTLASIICAVWGWRRAQVMHFKWKLTPIDLRR